MISRRYFVKKAQEQESTSSQEFGTTGTGQTPVFVAEDDPELNAASNESNVRHNELIMFEQMKAVSKGMPLPPGQYWVIPPERSLEFMEMTGWKGNRGYAKPGAIAIGTDRSNVKHFLVPHYVSLDESSNFKLKPLRERPYEKNKDLKGPALLTDNEIKRLLGVVPVRERRHWERYLESLTESQRRALTGGERNWLVDFFTGSDQKINRRKDDAKGEIQKFYVDKSMLESLTKLANELDKKGLNKEASIIDHIVSSSVSQKG